jgi:hypothetical protein
MSVDEALPRGPADAAGELVGRESPVADDRRAPPGSAILAPGMWLQGSAVVRSKAAERADAPTTRESEP